MAVQSPSPQLSPMPSPGDSPSKPAGCSVPSPWPPLSAAPSVCVLPSLLPCLEWEGRGRAAGAAAPSAVALPAGGDSVRDCRLLRLVPTAHRRDSPPLPVSLYFQNRGGNCRQLPAAEQSQGMGRCLHLPALPRELPSASRSLWPAPGQLGVAEAVKTEGTDLAGRREP